MSTCTVDQKGNVTPCKPLADAEVMTGKGIRSVTLVKTKGPKEGETRNVPVLYSGQFKKGIFLNYCPFCGARLRAE